MAILLHELSLRDSASTEHWKMGHRIGRSRKQISHHIKDDTNLMRLTIRGWVLM